MFNSLLRTLNILIDYDYSYEFSIIKIVYDRKNYQKEIDGRMGTTEKSPIFPIYNEEGSSRLKH